MAGDTKHILAWVKENNPKQYVEDRYDKTKQPGAIRTASSAARNATTRAMATAPIYSRIRRPAPTPPASKTSATPTTDRPPPARPGRRYHWGYASGVIATKGPGWGEFVLAELTQTFDKSDPPTSSPSCSRSSSAWAAGHATAPSMPPMMPSTCISTSMRPAVAPPCRWSKRAATKGAPSARTLPLCAAGLPMPLKCAFTDRTTTLVVHERGKYVCPLRHPSPTPHATARSTTSTGPKAAVRP